MLAKECARLEIVSDVSLRTSAQRNDFQREVVGEGGWQQMMEDSVRFAEELAHLRVCDLFNWVNSSARKGLEGVEVVVSDKNTLVAFLDFIRRSAFPRD